jgi:hypothetical protein
MPDNYEHGKKDEPCAVINVYCGGDKKPHPRPKHKKCCEKGTGLPEFGEVFSIASQTLAPSIAANQPGGIVLLEQLRFATTGIDVTNAGVNGNIVINESGWYNVASGITGSLNPIPAPLPVWTMSLFKNGVIIPGSTFSNVPLSPAQQSNQITADALVHFNKGDILTLANTSTDQLFAAAPSLGTTAQTNSAYVKIMMLRKDCNGRSQFVADANVEMLNAFNAAQQCFIDATAANISQLNADAVVAQASANAALNAGNLAKAAILASQPYASAASYAESLSDIDDFLPQAIANVSAANTAVALTDPANTAALVLSSSKLASFGADLLESPLQDKDCEEDEEGEGEQPA